MTHYNELLILEEQEGPYNNFQMEMRVEFNYTPGTPATPDGDAGEPDELELLAVKVLSADNGEREFYRCGGPNFFDMRTDVMFESMETHFMRKLEGSEVLWELAEGVAA